MTHVRIEPTDGGPAVILLAGGSTITDGDGPADILPVVISKLRGVNRTTPAREVSIAIQRAEEALHWLDALNRRAR